MINRIKTTVGTLVLTGMLALPVWAQIGCPPTPPPPTGCPNIVAEMEPNDLLEGQDLQDLGMLQPGGCVTVSPASIDGGVSSQTPDADFYLLGVSGVTQLNIQLQTDGVIPFMYAIFDAYTGTILAECAEATCQAALQTEAVVIGVVAQDVAAYDLTVTAAGSQGMLSTAASDTAPLNELQKRVLNLR
jgi:hypothetical protein